MQLLVWKGYGEIALYDYHVRGGFLKLKTLVHKCMSYGYPEEVLNEISNSKTVGELLDLVNEFTQDDDSFERFEIVEVQQV